MVLETVLGRLATGPYGPIVTAVFQERTPAELRGRFFGTALALDNATTSPVILLTGALVGRADLGMVLVAVAAANLAVTGAVVAQPALRELDAERRAS